MLRLALLICLTLAASAAVAPQAPANRQLVIDAVVVDRDGTPVMDLRQDEFEIWIGKYRVPIETFVPVTPTSPDRAGQILVLVLDDFALPQQVIPRGRDVARRLVSRLPADDGMAVLTLNGDRMNSTTDRARLLDRINSWNNRATGHFTVDTLGAHVFETVEGIARSLAEVPGGRKTIVGIGAAWVFDRPIPIPTVGIRDLRSEWTAAMRAASIANAALYVVDPSGVGGTPVTGGETGFAAYTGGHTFLNTNDLETTADRIMAEARNYYLFGVADPPFQRKADLRDLEMRVLRKGLTVRARKAIHGTETPARR
jgi:VWFA-related protein